MDDVNLHEGKKLKTKIGILISLGLLVAVGCGLFCFHTILNNHILEFDEVMDFRMDLNSKTKVP